MNTEFKDLIGKTLTGVRVDPDKRFVDFIVNDGSEYRLAHSQSCCESVTVDDVCGEVSDLVGSPILQAEENSNQDREAVPGREFSESFTWTFYRIATMKGQVVIRWLGESNGYYSESVQFDKLK